MKAVRAFLAGGVALVAASSALAADTMTLDFTGVGAGKNVNFSYDGSAQQVFAGQLKWKVLADTSGNYSVGDTIRTFCIDIFQHAGDGTFELGNVADSPKPGGGMGAAKAAMIEHLYSKYYWLVNDSSATNNNAAAFQVAVWEIVNEDINVNSLSIANGAGKFFVKNSGSNSWGNSDAARLTAQGWLQDVWSAFGNNTLMEFNGFFRALASNGGQDQIIANLVLVPVPAPVMLGAAGLLGLAVLRKRRTA